MLCGITYCTGYKWKLAHTHTHITLQPHYDLMLAYLRPLPKVTMSGDCVPRGTVDTCLPCMLTAAQRKRLYEATNSISGSKSTLLHEALRTFRVPFPPPSYMPDLMFSHRFVQLFQSRSVPRVSAVHHLRLHTAFSGLFCAFRQCFAVRMIVLGHARQRGRDQMRSSSFVERSVTRSFVTMMLRVRLCWL